MAIVLEIVVLLLTALLSGASGYWYASKSAAPMIADLVARVDIAERGLYTQGQAIRELTEALRGMLAELDTRSPDSPRREAVIAARQLLMRH